MSPRLHGAFKYRAELCSQAVQSHPEEKTRSSQKKDDKFGALQTVQQASSHLEAVFLSSSSTKAHTVPRARQKYWYALTGPVSSYNTAGMKHTEEWSVSSANAGEQPACL